MKRTAIFLAKCLISIFFSPLLFVASLVSKRSKSKPRLFWGPVPIINNKYWSEAMKEAGYTTHTVMNGWYSINSRQDFDIVYEEFIPKALYPLRRYLSPLLPYLLFIYCIGKFDIFHIPMSGGILGNTPLRRIEAFFLKIAGCKVVCLPYGADAYVYDEIRDLSLKHALLISYPEAGKYSAKIKKDILYWSKHADAIVLGFMTDSFPRWDVLMGNFISLDVGKIQKSAKRSDHDGTNGEVQIFHTPNHRGCKGTEFIVKAVEALNKEGIKAKLRLIEGKKNEEVLQLLTEQADILCDQLIIPGYGLSGIEGMAAGLPVIANLESEDYLRIFRRFAFLDQCPIVSSTPESIYTQLKCLVTNPGLRRQLGDSGRKYVEKFHSYHTARFLFDSIYQKIWHHKKIELMTLFHPLKSDFYHLKFEKIYKTEINNLSDTKDSKIVL